MMDHFRRLELEPVSSLEEVLERGGLWLDWPAGTVPPAPPPFWGELVTERMRGPHRDPAPFDRVGLACIPNATVSYQGFVGDEMGRLFVSAAHYPNYLNDWIERGERPPDRRPLSELKEIPAPETSVLVHHCHAEIYGHWLVECLPRLMYLRTLSLGPLRFVVEATARPHINVRRGCSISIDISLASTIG